MSKTRSLHHIVFATKNRRRTIPEEHKKKLYAYIMGILSSKKCFLHRINGIHDHIHILLDLHPSVCLADLVKDIKRSSTNWLRRQPEFCDFDTWCDGYFAESIGVEGLEGCKQYIINQEQHHLSQDFASEMEWFALKNNLEWMPEDFK
ncbi:MAG: IS200/IS605 family transposase [Bacteroidales bacterium]|nr:IS200/IS605 family transposase [Bacteroidales bacterium]